jgi:hypothetical protein
VVGQSDYRAFSSAGVQGPFPVRISVQEGDWVSILPGDNGGPCLANTGDPADASRVTQGQGDTPTGGTTLFFGCCNTTQHANVEALLEPDADNDGFGDETQDECPTDASTQGACPVGKANRAIRLDANKHHAHRGDRIKLVGRIESSDQAACADGQAVELQRERRRSKTWKAIGSATSDASGVFQLRYKLKRNRRYHFRAVLTETAACGEGVSNEDHVHADRDHR